MPEHLRWVKFWPQDWKGDAALRMCSLAARGLWMELICIMHEANPYGFLLISGKKPSEKQLAALVGTTPRELRILMAELEAAGVYSVDEQGIVFSRRMVKDEARRVKARIDGKRGGNPALVNPKTRDQDNPDGATELTGGVNPQEAEAKSKNPPTPLAGARGANEHIQECEETTSRPPGWRGQWRGLRANGTAPRQLAAAAEATKPPPPEPDGPIWPILRDHGMTATEYRVFLAAATVDEPARRVVVASPFVRSRIQADHGHALERAGWKIEAAS